MYRNKQWLSQKYYVEKLFYSDIAELCHVQPATIYRWFKKLGLKEEPFSTTPDPLYFYSTDEHRECLNRLEIAIRLRRGLSVVFGRVGTGKTLLSRKLIERFREDQEVFTLHLMLDPTFNSDNEFLRYLIELFEIRQRGETPLECMDILKNYLLKMGIERTPLCVT